MDSIPTLETTMIPESVEVLTVGHSTMSIARFLSNLQKANVTAIADVRSSPFSGRFPHFSQQALRSSLKENKIKYVFLGKELGGRPKSSHLYSDGIADYERMALEPEFCRGLARVIEGAKTHRIALMCSEHNPLDCHRCLLDGRALVGQGARLNHILNDGNVVGQVDVEERLLLELSDNKTDDLFASREERLAAAYRIRSRKVAYREAIPRSTDADASAQAATHEAAE